MHRNWLTIWKWRVEEVEESNDESLLPVRRITGVYILVGWKTSVARTSKHKCSHYQAGSRLLCKLHTHSVWKYRIYQKRDYTYTHSHKGLHYIGRFYGSKHRKFADASLCSPCAFCVSLSFYIAIYKYLDQGFTPICLKISVSNWIYRLFHYKNIRFFLEILKSIYFRRSDRIWCAFTHSALSTVPTHCIYWQHVYFILFHRLRFWLFC